MHQKLVDYSYNTERNISTAPHLAFNFQQGRRRMLNDDDVQVNPMAQSESECR